MPTVNLSDEEYKRRVQAIRDLFTRRVYDLYINAANGKIDTYKRFLMRLEWLETDYSDALSPYGIYEDLCPDDFDLVKMAIEEGTPLKDFAYQWLNIYNIIEFRNVDITSFIPIAQREEDNEDDDYNI